MIFFIEFHSKPYDFDIPDYSKFIYYVVYFLQIVMLNYYYYFCIIVLVEDCNSSKDQEELEFSEAIIKDLKGLGLDK